MAPLQDAERVKTRAMVWLAAAAFAMGIDGYVLTGLLPQIAADLDVKPGTAGQLVTVFVLVSAIAGPSLGALTGAWERKATILAALIVFICGNAIVMLSPDFVTALTGRIVSAVGGALLATVISAYVVASTSLERRGRALSIVLGGWLTATALGVPVGLVLGQGSWRTPFLLIVVVGLIAGFGIIVQIPRLHTSVETIRETLRPLRSIHLLGALIVPIGAMCASYLCFTYTTLIVGPRLGTGSVLVIILFGYGLLSLVGNILAGRLTDRFSPGLVLTLVLTTLLCAAMLGTVGSLMSDPAGAIFVLVWFAVCAIGNGGLGVPLQARLSVIAPDSVTLVLALNSSAMGVGAAAGSAAGGLLIDAGIGPGGLLLASSLTLLVTVTAHLTLVRAQTGPSRATSLATFQRSSTPR